MVRRFWWGNKNSSRFMALLSWNAICLPKEFGGLGFRKFKNINSALLSKLCWNLVAGKDELWSSLLKSKYLSKENFFDYHLKSGVSYTWRSIISARDEIKSEICYNLRDSKSIRPWKDPWIPWLQGRVPILKNGVDLEDGRRVEDLLLPDSNEWNLDLLEEICEPESSEAIRKVKCPLIGREDKILWLGNESVIFSVKNSYLADKKDSFNIDLGTVWKKIWKVKLHERL